MKEEMKGRFIGKAGRERKGRPHLSLLKGKREKGQKDWDDSGNRPFTNGY